MKEQKKFFVFTLVLFSLAVLACLLTPLFSFLSDAVPLSVYAVKPISRLLVVSAPFFPLGVAANVAREERFSHGLVFVGIYTGVELLFSVPLSLIAYDVSFSAPDALTLLIYMLTALVVGLIVLGCLGGGYALFLQREGDASAYSLKNPVARTVALGAASLSIYYLVTEIVDFLSYAQDRLWVLTGAEVFDFCYFVLWILLAGGFAYYVGCFGAKRLSAKAAE